ncbi:MAG: hypothetical protein LBT46_05090, partial [Planctomycetaceae bacterium]|nr:hypothetical protein [Planctomycetaceae bacterium]
MRIHLSTLIMLLVTLMFAGGSIGCRSNGGPWYNPKSYTWTKPFNSDGDPAKRNEAALADAKPSLGAQPSISTPPSGYTAGNYNTADKAEDARFHPSASPADSSKLASTSSPYGGYSAAEN